MSRSKKASIITVQNIPVTILNLEQQEYISLTDMAKARADSSRAADVIKNWLRARSTLEFLGTWEILYNPDFKVVEFDHFKSEADKIADGHMAGRLFLVQQPQKPDICFAQLLDPSDGLAALLHERKQDHLQQLFSVIS